MRLVPACLASRSTGLHGPVRIETIQNQSEDLLFAAQHRPFTGL